MEDDVQIELLDSARLLVADQESGDLVLHLKTAAGSDHYFGVTLAGGIRLVAQWGTDVRQIHHALNAGTAITSDTVMPREVLN